MTRLTASQTVGPFFGVGLTHPSVPDVLKNVVAGEGERLRIQGAVLDGDGAGVPDAMIEIWQANAQGRYHHPADTRDRPLEPGFVGFGRAGTDAQGGYWFETVRPGRVPPQAPHILVTVFARGMLNHAVTRLYFADEPANADDPVLNAVPAARRSTLLAAPTSHGYRFVIVLQGPRETVFFNV